MPTEAVDVRTAGLPWKPVVVAIPIKRNPVRIMTQTRVVQNLAYDPNSHMTQEAVGETVKPGELPHVAIQRALVEECGSTWVGTKIYGAYSSRYPQGGYGSAFTTGKALLGVSDWARLYQPYRLVVIETQPQPWWAAVFVVEVPENWVPNYEKADGEACEATWWDPHDLYAELHANPSQFFILHYPAYRELAYELICGRFKL